MLVDYDKYLEMHKVNPVPDKWNPVPGDHVFIVHKVTSKLRSAVILKVLKKKTKKRFFLVAMRSEGITTLNRCKRMDYRVVRVRFDEVRPAPQKISASLLLKMTLDELYSTPLS